MRKVLSIMSKSTTKAWTADKHPASTSALLDSLHRLRETQPKAVRSTVHVYPAAVYAAEDDEASKVSHLSGSAAGNDLRDRKITSWKMTEHMYRLHDNPFPTLARGLFTEEVAKGEILPEEALKNEGDWSNGRTRERIVARGYDKFFNIDEVDWTNWTNMESHTVPPYYLTLKSNGCLILISALSPTHLLVASKHSLGTVNADHINGESSTTGSLASGMEALSLGLDEKGKGKESYHEEDDDSSAIAHAEMGRRWVRKMLKAAGKTESELASRLWRDNLSAVLELCDDSFEEHVLATPAHWTGLHLHGLNHNTPHFATLSPPDVSAFAEEFGFIPTKYTQFDTLTEVKAFTDKVERDQTWEGDQIEGFVVRATVSQKSSFESEGKPPYLPGSPFFFKVKFNEPYLLYRQWREVTRLMLPLRTLDRDDQAVPPGSQGAAKTSRPEARRQDDKYDNIWIKVRKRTQRPEVAVYADWCGDMLKREPSLFDGYERGVVRVRERFLSWIEAEGKGAWQQAMTGKYKLRGNPRTSRVKQEEPNAPTTSKPVKWLVIPIAVPGCGKTLVGVALTRLFGFGHTQSDDVTAKRTAPTFLKNITDLFKTNDVVFADRNNHIDKHYTELANLATTKALQPYELRLVGVMWNVTDPPYHRVLRVCSDRILKRGDNHRTLRPDANSASEHEAVLAMFLRNWTPPDPDAFRSIIKVEVEDDPRTALLKVIDGLVEAIGLQRPSDEAIDEALNAGESYRITGPYKAPQQLLAKPPRYYALAPELNIPSLMSTILTGTRASKAKEVYDLVHKAERIVTNPHITICHRDDVANEEASAEETITAPMNQLWKQCQMLAEHHQSYDFHITHLVWDDRVLCLAVTLSPHTDEPLTNLSLPVSKERQLHITVGTVKEDIRTMESIKLVLAMRDALDKDADSTEAQEVIPDGGRVRWIEVKPSVRGQGRVRGMW
ncbi:RNA ligase-domain-containing protein [Kockovaella imperatae]|uniref:RNA ligase-domain-containing protein n=1 Tax=Kockovaella imperatae TaxID=4999 RepID=A0A1Y1UGV9_9TREE|nr:RNA ligase-domain-containing protein [Kockovaella imperatae]ORX37301.1 RNA ligase-domain-containing protein [Kockovaella imperatae]